MLQARLPWAESSTHRAGHVRPAQVVYAAPAIFEAGAYLPFLMPQCPSPALVNGSQVSMYRPTLLMLQAEALQACYAILCLSGEGMQVNSRRQTGRTVEA